MTTDADKDQWYDKVVRPKLEGIGKFCDANGMPFVSAVEFLPGRRHVTVFIPLIQRTGIEMTMLRLCAQAGPDVDKYITSLSDYCILNGVDVSHSAVMRIAETLELG